MYPDADRMTRTRQEQAQRDAEPTLEKRGLAALEAIGEAIGDASTVQQVFTRTLDVLRQLTGCANIALRLYVPELHCLKLMAQSGMTPAMMEELACLSADWGMMADVVRERRPVFSTDMPGEPERVGFSSGAAGYQSIVSVPLLASDRLVGTMELATTERHTWSESELRWLALLGRSVGLNVQHVQLVERLHHLAITQERRRLAQELHDGLGQMIGSIHIWAEEGRVALAEADVAAALKACDKIDSAAQDAYNTLRDEIVDLRQASAPGENLIPMLLKLLERYYRQWNIATELSLPGGATDARFRIPPAQEIQLLRVIREALTNVRRHARATHVVVRISDRPAETVLSIEDDGQGFDPAAVGEEQLGLRIMRERVASVGGEIEIDTQVGHGTTVRVRLPKTIAECECGEDDDVPAASGR